MPSAAPSCSRDDRGPLLPSGGAGTGPPGGTSSGAPDGDAGPGPDGRGGDGDGAGDPPTLWLAGDVMTGRGVDQVLRQSVDPGLHERFVKDARRYVELAEEENGPIPAPVGPRYVWGDALEAFAGPGPDVRVVNLETAVTTRDEPWPGKRIHYRMHPGNVDVLEAAGLDVCVLANNHALDWGREGLLETLEALRGAGVAVAGAGRDAEEARAPAVVDPAGRDGRVLVFAFGSTTAGVPGDWAAAPDRPGVALLPDLSRGTARDVARHVAGTSREGDLVVLSLHWGGNWGYRVPGRQRRFARRLVEEGNVDVVHGHSSHHPKGMEVHRGRPILHGCGDLINDYEGISGHEEFRPDLVLLYRVRADPPPGRPAAPRAGGPPHLEAVPFRIRRLRLERAAAKDARWLAETLDRESADLGARVELADGPRLVVGPAR
jgi:poly-gamma-glutamate synthesis protein (capsule biosynthesis protein)